MKAFEIVLNTQVWTVKIDHMRSSKLSTPGGDYYGICNYDTYEILIGKLENTQSMSKTFIHELTHAILFSHMLERKKSFNEEDVCNFTAKYFVLMDSIIKRWTYFIEREYTI